MVCKTERCQILDQDRSKVIFFLTSRVTTLCHRKQLKTLQNSSPSYGYNKNLQNPHNKSGRIKHANSKIKSSSMAYITIKTQNDTVCTWTDMGLTMHGLLTCYSSNTRQAGLHESMSSNIYLSFLCVQKLAPY